MKIWELTQFRVVGSGMRSYRVIVRATTAKKAKQIASADMLDKTVWTDWASDTDIKVNEIQTDGEAKVLMRFTNSF